jgi:hypothetical protein
VTLTDIDIFDDTSRPYRSAALCGFPLIAGRSIFEVAVARRPRFMGAVDESFTKYRCKATNKIPCGE